VQLEGLHADGKKADFKVTSIVHGRSLSIPIEAKKGSSDDLWTAIDGQLIPRYTRDPDSQGHGIFIVFWFGKTKRPPRGPHARHGRRTGKTPP
jgi:hypothetical protein